jgi:hypothetical protein
MDRRTDGRYEVVGIKSCMELRRCHGASRHLQANQGVHRRIMLISKVLKAKLASLLTSMLFLVAKKANLTIEAETRCGITIVS